MFIVAETDVRYLLPARLDDELEVSVQGRFGGRVGLTLEQQAWRIDADGAASTLLAEGTHPHRLRRRRNLPARAAFPPTSSKPSNEPRPVDLQTRAAKPAWWCSW